MKEFRKWFREWLREANKFLFLPKVIIDNRVVKWNTQKSEAKFLSQLNDRIKVCHITNSEKLGAILTKGLSIGYNNCVSGKGRENDTCFRFSKSEFTVIFNKDEHSIIGIRKPTDRLNCNKQKTVFENCEGLGEFAKELGLDYIDMGEIYDGIRFNFVGDTSESVQAVIVCKKCIDIDL